MERRMADARRIFDPLKPLNPPLGKRAGHPD